MIVVCALAFGGYELHLAAGLLRLLTDSHDRQAALEEKAQVKQTALSRSSASTRRVAQSEGTASS